ncbi:MULTISPECIES: NAD(P)-dependent alcohol dehydrogenase [Pseudomonas]|uniref:NAD(P)-dependent alcohol dehydrogenase n=1 Tax=Pseudomonas sessilinigenes TaxID=658629 RepID=A0ABX8MJ83_9PSED|nr:MULTISPECIES: NAD(P)-dependent alcohol dehydrogenase [Pseudomonas]AZC18540.1 Alcohol dehydrogenase [Pseudomonas sp. CMR5c]AZC26646.1 Alcohol dehydrogenase [Pseudomonas sessilinigenes]QXH39363.1 NAD(P)-dependent alcohol dehydrogenase [Pseudomonas sessilinigenes]
MKIIAAVTRHNANGFCIEDLELDDPLDEEVLVRIVAVGICHTDLVAASGVLPIQAPAVFGHEGAGIVVKVGNKVTSVRPGDHVALSFHSCGQCERCAIEDPSYCHSFGLLNFTGIRQGGSNLHDANGAAVAGSFFGQSSFASHCVANQRNVVKVSKDIPLSLVAPMGCGIQTGFGGVTRALACTAGSSILILGGGAVGLAAIMGAVLCGCEQIILVEPHANRRALALELGATCVIDPYGEDTEKVVKALLPTGVNYALDTCGINAALETAYRCLAPRATFGLVGAPQDWEQKLPGSLAQMIQNGIIFKGIIEGDSDPQQSIPELISLYQEGRLPIDRLVSDFPLSQINEAVAAQHAGTCVKPVLLPN